MDRNRHHARGWCTPRTTGTTHARRRRQRDRGTAATIIINDFVNTTVDDDLPDELLVTNRNNSW